MIINKSCPLFLLGFVLCTIYIPGWVGASISTGWLFLLITMPVVIYFSKIPSTNAHFFGTLFLIYNVLSLIWTQNFNIAFFILLQTLVLGIIFCFGSSIKNIIPIIKGIALGLLISDGVALAQYYSNWEGVYTLAHGAAGLFVNINMFCEISAILLVALIAYKLYFWIPVTLPALILIHSRSAILALIICFLVWAWSKSKIVCIVLLPLICLSIYEYTLYRHFDFNSIYERFNLWKDSIRGLTLFGTGVGSYELLFPLNAIHIDTAIARPKYAHNDLLQVIFEFGIGFIFFLIFLWEVLKTNYKERYILYAVLIISMFSFPLHIPVSAFIFFLVAGFVTNCDDTSGDIGSYSRPILSKRNKK